MRILIADDHIVFSERLKRIFAEATDIAEIGQASNAQQQLLECVAGLSMHQFAVRVINLLPQSSC
jgi:DNA-binding NarL/FixJ family response regulator